MSREFNSVFGVEWCLGMWCPFPRPSITPEQIEALEGFGLRRTQDADMWLGLPVFEGFVRGVYVALSASLVFVEGDCDVQWRVRLTQESALANLGNPDAFRFASDDAVAAITEFMLADDASVSRETLQREWAAEMLVGRRIHRTGVQQVAQTATITAQDVDDMLLMSLGVKRVPTVGTGDGDNE